MHTLSNNEVVSPYKTQLFGGNFNFAGVTAIIPERPKIPPLFTHTHACTHAPCAHASIYKFPQN